MEKKMRIVFLAVHNNMEWVRYNHLPFSLLTACLSRSPHLNRLELVEMGFGREEPAESMVEALKAAKPDLLAVSCYVWNIEIVLGLLPGIKGAFPKMKIVLGGPELEIGSTEPLLSSPWIDFVVPGEGERVFRELVEFLLLEPGGDPGGIRGIIHRRADGTPEATPPRPPLEDLDGIPSPFLTGTYDPSRIPGNTVMVQTQRGCPLNCLYCYEHNNHPRPRSFSLTRTFEEFGFILQREPSSIFILDSCLNSNRRRVKRILSFIIQNRRPGLRSIHAEMVPEFMDEEMIQLAEKAGLRPIEIGIQSLDPGVLRTCGRYRNNPKLFRNIDLSIKHGVRICPQIIYGLPGDDLDSFFKTFDGVYAVPCPVMEMFKLMVLPNTGMRARARELGIDFSQAPPYAVRSTPALSGEELNFLDRFKNIFFITLPMKAEINAVALKAGIKPHRIFSDFVKQRSPDRLAFHFKVRDDREKELALAALDEFSRELIGLAEGAGDDRFSAEIGARAAASEKKSRLDIVARLLEKKSVEKRIEKRHAGTSLLDRITFSRDVALHDRKEPWGGGTSGEEHSGSRQRRPIRGK